MLKKITRVFPDWLLMLLAGKAFATLLILG
jgi:hypothetical protein